MLIITAFINYSKRKGDNDTIMELLTLLLTILNTILIVLFGLKYFKDNYTIVSIQDWNTLANFYNDHADEYDEDGKPIKEEKAGGFGFQTYIEEESEEE